MESEAIDILQTYEYEVFSQIGEGAFGKCFLVKSQKYDEEFACKYVNLRNINEAKQHEITESFNREYRILKSLSNKYILNIFDYIHSSNYLFLILQLCSNGSLKTLRKSVGCLLKNDIYRYIFEISSAIEYLHSEKYAHHDVKPSNFLLDSNNQVIMADFGLSTKYAENELSTYRGGTLAFMAPEILADPAYDPFKADVWAFGITAYYLITGYVPWSAKDSIELRKLQTFGLYFPSSINFPNTIRKIIIKCLNINPSERPSFDEILKMLNGKVDQVIGKSSNLPALRPRGSFRIGSNSKHSLLPVARQRIPRPTRRSLVSKSLYSSIDHLL